MGWLTTILGIIGLLVVLSKLIDIFVWFVKKVYKALSSNEPKKKKKTDLEKFFDKPMWTGEKFSHFAGYVQMKLPKQIRLQYHYDAIMNYCYDEVITNKVLMDVKYYEEFREQLKISFPTTNFESEIKDYCEKYEVKFDEDGFEITDNCEHCGAPLKRYLQVCSYCGKKHGKPSTIERIDGYNSISKIPTIKPVFGGPTRSHRNEEHKSSSSSYTSTHDSWDIANPLNLLSPLNPINQINTMNNIF